ncbi:DUF3787 domain-containing protein [Citroniella saccharovorans]|uniref:DUF3787 domain-containing protein n=1 Tax=Citroniella saccharovorans TaxID=2053367 RepID=A0AAW9MVF8_9FIRM|nr:DUF3787 domain-containing protein [Citroniella saccharovorans]MEB3429564.1 DUF3787 domain-containing protein [Citroniella saccharovorans]
MKDKKELDEELKAKADTKETHTDIYSNTEYTLEDSNVAVPTEEANLEAKEWVDEENRR